MTSQRGWSTLENLYLRNESIPLEFVVDPKSSKFYRGMPDDALKSIRTKNMTFNYHMYGVSPQTYKEDPELSSFWDVLTVNKDKDDKLFVSSIEAKKYPIFATLYHPEKVQTIFQGAKLNININHSWESIGVSHYFSRFFVSMARGNRHSFENSELELSDLLIENHKLFKTPPTDEEEELGHIYVF